MADAIAVSAPVTPERARATERHPAFVWTFAAFLVTNMSSGHLADLHLNLPLGPDRIFFAATLILLVLDRRYSLRDIRWGSVHLVALAMVALASLSALAHDILFNSYGFFAVLDRLAIPYLVFTIAPVAFRRPADRLLILQVMTLIGIYLGITAFFEIIGPKSLVWPHYILDPSVGSQFGRARGPFAESEADGLTLMAAFWCAVLLFRVSPSRFWRWVAILGGVIAAGGALLTLTRSIWLGMVLSFVTVAILDRRLRRWLVVGLVTLGLGVGLALAGSSTLQSKATARFHDEGSVYDRRNTDAAAIRAIKDHPLTGVGWVQFIFVSGDYVRQDPNYPVTVTDIEIHNVVLSRTAELGIPGGVLWVISVLLGPGAAILRRSQTPWARTWRSVALGSTSVWAVTVMSSPVPYPLPNTLVWLFSGLALAPILVRRPDADPDAAY